MSLPVVQRKEFVYDITAYLNDVLEQCICLTF
jgi:hypothetical protein